MRQPPILAPAPGQTPIRVNVVGSFLRPVLGTDTAITNEFGEYSIVVPPGMYEVGLRHPKFAGTYDGIHANLGAGARQDQNITALEGCIVRGKVVAADGMTPAPDGAIEVNETGGTRFGPMARVALDGTFEFSTISSGFIRVRAWPWKSAPSTVRELHCEDGKRFENITLELESRAPDLAGTLTDANGERVPFTFVDLQAIDPGITGQQERSDAGGEWHFYDVEPGQYRITVAAEGRGVGDINLLAPKADVQLQLSGTGRISGTTSQLVDGSIQVAFLQCGNDTNGIDVPPETRIVPVHGGRFAIDGAPACTLRFHARWRSRTTEAIVVVEPNSTAYVALDLGAPHEKAVRGIVRDERGAPAANVAVTALIDEREASTVRTDPNGRFTITTRSGAQLLARSAGKVGSGLVGNANVPSEVVDIVLDSDAVEP
jgi:hypothetical protein